VCEISSETCSDENPIERGGGGGIDEKRWIRGVKFENYLRKKWRRERVGSFPHVMIDKKRKLFRDR